MFRFSLSASARLCAVTLVALSGVGLCQGKEVALEEARQEWVDFGGALRVRYEYNNRNGPYGGPRGLEDAASGFLRVRTRVWGEARAGKFTGHLQLGDEFRHYFFRESQKGYRRFPDQLYVDEAWVRYEQWMGFVSVKAGRQRLVDLGSTRLFSEGTPVDGSRSDFFDAVRLRFDFDQARRQLEVVGLMIAHHDWLPTWGEQHVPRGAPQRTKPYDYSGSNHRELGLVLYWRDRTNGALPWEAYAIWKQEEGAYSTALAYEPKRPRSFNTYTGGFRLMPKFSEQWSGEMELAVQTGDNRLLAGMGYGALKYAFTEVAGVPTAMVGVYGLTGDTDGTRGRRAWHALFNRSANLGDVVSSLYANLDHNNLLYPHAGLAWTPGAGTHALSLEVGPLFAPARERDELGRAGPYRGLLAQMSWNVDVAKLFNEPRLKGQEFLCYGAFLRMGNYFPEGSRGDLSTAALVEVRYTF